MAGGGGVTSSEFEGPEAPQGTKRRRSHGPRLATLRLHRNRERQPPCEALRVHSRSRSVWQILSPRGRDSGSHLSLPLWFTAAHLHLEKQLSTRRAVRSCCWPCWGVTRQGSQCAGTGSHCSHHGHAEDSPSLPAHCAGPSPSAVCHPPSLSLITWSPPSPSPFPVQQVPPGVWPCSK